MPSLSPSRASDFVRCPLLYRFRAVDRLPEPATPAMARGTLVHAVLESLFDLPAHERTRAAADALLPRRWPRMLAERPELADLADESDPVQLQAWYDGAARLLDRWFTLEDPTRLEPAHREYHVEADLGGLSLHGYVDRLDVAPDGRVRIVDYKTGRSPPVGREWRAFFQLRFYALVVWRALGRVPSRLLLVYLGDGEVLAYDPDEDDLVALERTLRALSAALERAERTGEYPPQPSRLCDWCAFRALCPAWGGTPPPLPGGAGRDAEHGADDRADHGGDHDDSGRK